MPQEPVIWGPSEEAVFQAMLEQRRKATQVVIEGANVTADEMQAIVEPDVDGWGYQEAWHQYHSWASPAEVATDIAMVRA